MWRHAGCLVATSSSEFIALNADSFRGVIRDSKLDVSEYCAHYARMYCDTLHEDCSDVDAMSDLWGRQVVLNAMAAKALKAQNPLAHAIGSDMSFLSRNSNVLRGSGLTDLCAFSSEQIGIEWIARVYNWSRFCCFCRCRRRGPVVADVSALAPANSDVDGFDGIGPCTTVPVLPQPSGSSD